MVTPKEIENCEKLERSIWEVQHEASRIASFMAGVVHDTAEKSTKALRSEHQLSQKKPSRARAAYVKARSASLKAILRLQIERAEKQVAELQSSLSSLAAEVDLGPLLDCSPE